MLLLSIGTTACAWQSADDGSTDPAAVASDADSGQAGPNGDQGPPSLDSADRVGSDGDAPAERTQTLSAILIEEIRWLVPAATMTAPSTSEFESVIGALQTESGLDITGRLSRSDIAILRALHGPELFSETISVAKDRLAAAGYNVDVRNSEFEDQLTLALLQVSHDAGAGPDSTLSVANLQRIDEATKRPPCSTEDTATAFRLNGAQALVDHLDQIAPPAPILLLQSGPITGDPELDQRIVERAGARGYRLRAAATALAPVDSQAMLGPGAASAWIAMREAAATEGVSMFAASGHRSSDEQRFIFIDRLEAVAGSPLESSSVTDEAIDVVLDNHAPPGFSKHQTGNAIDVAVPDVSLVDFASTEAFRWLSDHDFANAKRFGFVPSYPSGVDGLGPQPEPWEWLWVGVDVLFRCPPRN